MSDYEIFGWVGRLLDEATDCWFGQSDVQNGFWLAMKRRNLSAIIVNYDDDYGLLVEPAGVCVEVADGLNSLVGQDLISQEMVKAALTRALRRRFGAAGGVMIVWREGREIKVNVARFWSPLPYKVKLGIADKAGLWLN